VNRTKRAVTAGHVTRTGLTPRARFQLAAGLFAVAVSLVGLGGPALAAAVSPSAAAGRATNAGSGSAVSVSGTGRFHNLTVTVSQTKNLINQVVNVTWTGGTPTFQGGQVFGINYLQIMECWGDNPAGPDRTQCEFGAYAGDSRGGAYVASRQVTYGSPVDPIEPIKLPPGQQGSLNVPFASVTGDTVSNGPNPFYDQSSTNEIPFALTTSDGTGQTYFEAQTATQAPGLGCGASETTAAGATVPRGCWLVIVPRDNLEVDGTTRRGVTTQTGLVSSPLSMSNWNQRLVVPLSYQPVATACSIGAAERRTSGDEQITEAMSQWQPALCQNTSAVYGYSQLTDDLVRQELAATDPGLDFLSRPLPAGSMTPDKKPLYAPVALSGLAVAFNIESQSSFSAPASVQQRNGTRITSLNLSPRLVAKLLTQSYRDGVVPGATDVSGNPTDLTTDPDFLALNPVFKALTFSSGIAGMLVPLSPSDATNELWAWVNADPGARKFLDGAADPWGMKVNPNFVNLPLPRDDFPKIDPACQPFPAPQTPLCSLDWFPYASTMHAGARAAGRGDLLLRTTWGFGNNPPTWGPTPAEPEGQRAVLAVADVATATRDGLPMASLCDDSGNNCVQPGTASLLAGATAMVPSGVDGVVVPVPGSLPQGAYPLTTLTYAATVPSELSTGEAKDYAALLRYAVGPGQATGDQPGQLPLGYVPLPATMQQQTLAAADTIVAVANHAPSPSPSVLASGGENLTVTVGGSSGGGLGLGNGSGTGAGLGAPTSAAASPAPSARILTASPVPTSTSAGNRTLTAARPLGAVRYVLLVALLIGGLAVGAGPGLTVLSRSPRFTALSRR
jgi:hypothetical protein